MCNHTSKGATTGHSSIAVKHVRQFTGQHDVAWLKKIPGQTRQLIAQCIKLIVRFPVAASKTISDSR